MRFTRAQQILSVIFFLHLSACSADTSAFVRVNQVGYQTGRTARAYLMSKGKVEGCKFSVKGEQEAEVFSGTVGGSAGTWGKYKVYALDFTIEKPGNYYIAVTGTVSAKSPEFKVDTAASLYSGTLSNALSFYRDQRDGGDFIASDLRKKAGHLNDKTAETYRTPEFEGDPGRIKGGLVSAGGVIDASGGWTDAGDYLKFVHTTSYVVALMLVGRRDFPNQMGPASRGADFTAEAKFGLDWLLRMWDDNSKTLYYQVGIGSPISGAENDHSIWRMPQDDDTSHGTDKEYRYIRNRPVFIAGPPGSKISPNLAGRLAGDFALCYRIFHASNSTYANRCLLAAEHIFDLADTAPTRQLVTAAPFEFYAETQWRDDLEFAATELYLAVREGNLPAGLPHSDADFYLKSAAEWAAQYIRNRGQESGVLDAADMSGLAHFDLYRAIGTQKSATQLAVTQAQLLGDLRKTLDHSTEQAAKDAFGFGISWGEGDTPARGFAIVVMAKEYDYLSKGHTFSDFADRWVANSLGANPWGISFIVGDGSTFPHCTHHQVANLAGSNDGKKPILAGAVVEGSIRKLESGVPWGAVRCPPSGKDPFEKFNGPDAKYLDDVKYYSTNEPAIDLTASSFLAFSWQVTGAPANTF
jgi:endoglucanase